jgi:Xaa-Pro dipeptidase
MVDPTQQLETLFAPHLDVIRARFERALAATGYSAVLLYSGPLPYVFTDDITYPFKVHASFKVWAPLTDVPDCFIYFEPGKRPLLLLHSPTDYWHKPASVPLAYWTKHFDIRPVEDRISARELLPQDLSSVAYLGEVFAELPSWNVGALNPSTLTQRLDYERAAKTPYELACLREANRLGALGHTAAFRAFEAGASEFEIQLAFLEACGLREQELPYNPIIALNEGGAILHYQLLEKRRPYARHSLLIDAGAEFGGYASDITRTYSFADADFATLINKFDELQQSLCSSVRAGVDWRDVHLSAHHLIGELLHESEITLCDADEAVDTGISSVFMPHGLGHLLGLQVHDTAGLQRSPEGGEIPRPDGHPFLRLTRILEEGFVVTMEPGLYFIDQLLNQAKADSRNSKINWLRVHNFRKFGGIRIEDDLAITDTGSENLTRDAFAATAASTAQSTSSYVCG